MNTCRVCLSPTHPFLSLGSVPLPEEFRMKTQRNLPIRDYPLGLSCCTRCHHVQLTHIVSSDPIYKQHYFYDYSVTATGLGHWQRLARQITRRYLKDNNLVVDIGSNTGTLLSCFQAFGARIRGVDPTNKLAAIARSRGIPTMTNYFTPSVARRIVRQLGQATVATGTNVFDHVDSLQSFLEAMQILLAPRGVFIVEVPYFLTFLTSHSHIVYHQQIDYMMMTPLIPLFDRYDMELVNTEPIPIHGGSIRLSIRKKGVQKAAISVSSLLSKEQVLFATYPRRLKKFADALCKQREDFSLRVRNLKAKGKRIAAVGASAKGITLLNYAGLGPREIDYITEKSPLKIGRFTPTGIPIVADRTLITDQPDYAILLAWNFTQEIMNNLNGYRGKWIIPVPSFRVI